MVCTAHYFYLKNKYLSETETCVTREECSCYHPRHLSCYIIKGRAGSEEC
jgi:hypothetical protein